MRQWLCGGISALPKYVASPVSVRATYCCSAYRGAWSVVGVIGGPPLTAPGYAAGHHLSDRPAHTHSLQRLHTPDAGQRHRGHERSGSALLHTWSNSHRHPAEKECPPPGRPPSPVNAHPYIPKRLGENTWRVSWPLPGRG